MVGRQPSQACSNIAATSESCSYRPSNQDRNLHADEHRDAKTKGGTR